MSHRIEAESGNSSIKKNKKRSTIKEDNLKIAYFHKMKKKIQMTEDA